MAATSHLEAGPRRIAFLEYLRIFAFLTVVLGHEFYPAMTAVTLDPGVHVTVRTLTAMLMPLCWGGGAGVAVFFLVSGYIICHVLQAEDTTTFVLKRIFRIYPLYWAAVVLEAVVGNLVSGTPWPPLSVWIPRLLLLGDFFGTPHALANVEWTLRIEILFYAVMALLRATVLIRHIRWMPALFVGISFLLQLIGPFPTYVEWTRGTVTLFLPILFIGANVYLGERRLASVAACVTSSAILVATYLLTLPEINRLAIESNFLVYALAIFVTAWAFRGRLADHAAVRFLASLTYAVYLFHLWGWPYLGMVVDRLGVDRVPHDLQVFVLLLLLCAGLHLTIERGGIRLGARLSAWLRAGFPTLRRYLQA